jgi:type I restriction enzyme S subunit
LQIHQDYCQPLMTTIAAHIRERYPNDGPQELYAANLASACQRFVDSGLADLNFSAELTSGLDSKFWSRVSEALLAERLNDKKLLPRSTPGPRPDFLVLQDNRKVWIELICPEPVGLPDSWLNVEPGTAGNFPHQAILLRWTSAIKDKAEKLIGSGDGKTMGYFHNGVVAADDAYVIAINGCRLRHGPFSALLGISQFPFAAEAVLPIGPYQVQMNSETFEVCQHGHSVRFHVEKSNGVLVSISMFLDTHYSAVSAIWAVELDGSSVVGNHEPTAVIHNPLATNPVPCGFLNADDEYVAAKSGDWYLFSKVEITDIKNGRS